MLAYERKIVDHFSGLYLGQRIAWKSTESFLRTEKVLWRIIITLVKCTEWMSWIASISFSGILTIDSSGLNR